MKKLYYLIVLALILGLVLTGCLLSNVGQVPATEQSGVSSIAKNGPPPGSTCINFESTELLEGDSVEGEGRVNDWLNIQLGFKELVLVKKETTDISFLAYRANVLTKNNTNNGCLDGSWGFAVCPVDDSSKRLAINDEIVFSFPVGVTVSHFSIDIFDYGDWYPGGGTEPVQVSLKDQNNNTSVYTFNSSASATLYDACEGTEGIKTLVINEAGITEVTLSFSGKMDPGVAFDNICFIPEPITCSKELQAGNPKNGDNFVGDVMVEYTPGDKYITVNYSTEDPWKMEEIHFHASFVNPDSWLAPVVNKAGNPAPGHFLVVDEDLGGSNSESFTIPLTEIGAPGCGALYFAAHAKVYKIIEGCFEKVWQIGNIEESICGVSLNLSNYADEFNWSTIVGPTLPGPCIKGSGLAVVEPVFDNPYIVGTDFSNFPYNSNKSRNYATDFDIQWTGELPFGGRLILSWSPGNSAFETKEISGDGIIGTKTFTAQGTKAYGMGWFDNQYKLVENEITLDPLSFGDHLINLQHTSGDGTYWDWIRLEKPCIQEETAWGDGPDFPDAKNWSMYFYCTEFVVPCPVE